MSFRSLLSSRSFFSPKPVASPMVSWKPLAVEFLYQLIATSGSPLLENSRQDAIQVGNTFDVLVPESWQHDVA